MMKIKMIKTEKDYQDALARVEVLMDAAHATPEEEELDLLSFLVDKYEEEHFPIDLPDPVEAIKFRMEQQGLTRRELVHYIGSQSKVSEVLNHKRPLSLAMIRALHTGLNIPAEVLLKIPGREMEENKYDPQLYPIKDMFKAGYFENAASLSHVKENGEEFLADLLEPLQSIQAQRVFCRQTVQRGKLTVAGDHSNLKEISENNAEYLTGQNEKLAENSLIAWQARVLAITASQKIQNFDFSQLTQKYIKDIIQLSVFPNGPLLAQSALMASGIHFVLLKQLPKTYLDGACFMSAKKNPIIAMTLRYDRLDNFWFTLTHELAHVFLHLRNNHFAFFDDTDHVINEDCDQLEREANDWCIEMLIPAMQWEDEKSSLLNTQEDEIIINFAQKLNIHPSIVAGRIRWEKKDYSIFNNLLGSGIPHKLFLV